MDISNELAIGIDIGGTNTKYGVVNHRGEILHKGELRTDQYEKVEPFIDALYNTLHPLISSLEQTHTIIVPGGRLHEGTGAHGSLEVYASATGVAKTAMEMLEENPGEKSLMRNSPEKITSKTVYECAMKGDAIAKRVYDFTGKILGE